MPTIAAFRLPGTRAGCRYVFRNNDLGYIGNFSTCTFEIGWPPRANQVFRGPSDTLA